MSATRERGVRVFENDILDWMSRAHPAFPALFWVPGAIASIVWGLMTGTAWFHMLWLVVVGFIAWTFFEYVLHRWIFHFVPESKTLRRHYYLVHQIHHEYHEWDRLVAPPMMSVTLGVIFLGLFYLLFGGHTWMWGFFAGFIFGYLAYDYVHFYTHFGRPKSRTAKMLRRRHMQHHTTYPNRWYGVSSPLWDYVFRTHVRPDDRPVKKEQIEWNPPIIAE
jgi:sterol desaturase/sphingolipid hydroxylase (fatty acid hydroxylase superfamily)